jgi:phosphate transport system substrate-binding protein
MYTPSLANQMVCAFTRFVVSHAGQEIVEQVGLISQIIKQETIYKIKGAPQIYNNYTEMAKRLSVNFRFTSGSNELDNKGQHDLLRLVDYMTKQQGRRIVLMGFSDSLGKKERNLKLSILRARMLEKALTARGLSVVAVEGFGELLPIASNQNELGRSKNRRVEVWIF